MKRTILGCVAFGCVLVAACGGDTGTAINPPADGSAGDSANNGGDGGNNPDGAANPDGSNNLDASNPDGSGTSSLSCGTLTCNLSTDSCCVVLQGGGSTMYTCAPTCPMGSTALKCASAADCSSSEVCCANPMNDPITSQCKVSCAAGEAMLCDPSASEVQNRCGDAGTCSTTHIADWGLPMKYGTCGGLPN